MNNVFEITVKEATDAIEAEAADGLSVTLNATKVEGVPTWKIQQREEWPGDTIADATGLVIHTDDAIFLGTLDDASEFPRILVSLS